ncbi:MAG: homocysteine S-methyltransferase [Gammaproteobacteria bacterium]|nr:homocysteine S-methyltransferase [Gammaproteobacteria bacterium]
MTDHDSSTAEIPNWMQSALGLSANDVVCLDGGLATELENRGYQFNTKLWSAELLLNNPTAIHDSHMAYLEADARIITSASYQATLQGLSDCGIDPDRSRKVLTDSIDIALQARDDYRGKSGSGTALVAASIGPYGAYLANGSEYRGNYGLNIQSLVDFHQERIGLMDGSGADILALETIPDHHEACALASILKNVSTPCWISFSCNDADHLRDGTPIQNSAALFRDIQSVFAIGVNCTSPEHVTPLIRKLRSSAPSKSVIAYPNSGEDYQQGTWSGEHSLNQWQQGCRDWINAGARIIGGCCRIGPDEIKQLADIIDSSSRTEER